MSNYNICPSLPNPPTICCGIQIKTIVSVFQAISILTVICFIIKENLADFNKIYAVMYWVVSFIVFRNNHIFLMSVHFWMEICIHVALLYYVVYQPRILIDLLKEYGDRVLRSIDQEDWIIFITVIIIINLLVNIFYIVMCKRLINALKEVPLLPQYTQNANQPDRGFNCSPESVQLVHLVDPKI